MEPEKISFLEDRIFNNDWENRKITLREIISIVCTLISKKVQEKDFFYSERLQISYLLVQKTILHGSSILSLVDGVELPIKTSLGYIKDPFSINILFRGLLESYLVLNHINFSETEEENEIKFNLWKQYGLRQRGKLIFTSEEIKPSAKLVLEKERIEIENLVNEICSSNFYLSLDPDKQKTFAEQLEKDWKFGFKKGTYIKYSFQQLLDKSGIKEKCFSGDYNFLSWSAHSTYISLNQLHDIYYEKRETAATINMMTKTAIFIALACTDLIKKDNDLKIQYDRLNQDKKDLINIYNYACRDDNYTIEKIQK